MEVFAWAEGERDRHRRQFFQLLERGREIWTPRHIFNRCCVKWLIDGPIQYDAYGFYDQYNPRNGCNGRCNRDHPYITLRFDADTKSTIANLSHRLDPFVHFMNSLVEEGKAWPQSASEYQINGYLRSNITLLRSHNGFGGHLVKVESGEIDASDAAQAAELDEQENSRAVKRPRKTEEGEDGYIAVENMEELSRAALDIVAEQMDLHLQDDPLTLFCIRQVSKSWKKVAESIASTKAQTLDFTITPLINGKQRYGEYKLDRYDSEYCEAEGWGGGDMYVAEYTKLEKISLASSEVGDDGYSYEPANADAATFSWDSGKLDRDADDEYTRSDEDDASYSEYAYTGQLLRVYWHPKDVDQVKSPLEFGFYGEQKSLGFCIAKFSFHGQLNIGIAWKSQCGVTVNYEVLESNTSVTEEVIEEEEVSEYETDEEAEDGERRIVKIVERMGNYIQYTGRIKILSTKVDFGVIVRLHASKVMDELNDKYSSILKQRPLTTTETEYLQFVERACKY